MNSLVVKFNKLHSTFSDIGKINEKKTFDEYENYYFEFLENIYAILNIIIEKIK